jgi:hypothetical protein
MKINSDGIFCLTGDEKNVMKIQSTNYSRSAKKIIGVNFNEIILFYAKNIK